MPWELITTLILVLSFGFDLVKHILSAAQRTKPLPENVQNLYDESEYARWQRYAKEQDKVALFSTIASFLLHAALLLTDLPARFYAASGLSGFWGNAALLGIYILLSLLVGMPFEYSSSIKIESKYGFNKSSRKTFVLDQLKGLIVETLLMGVLFAIVWGFGQMEWGGKYVLAFCAVALLMVLLSTFGMLTQKLFNKFEPLPDSPLKEQLTKLFESSGFSLKAILVMDASKRTTKVNAFCTGLGKFKEIALYDNLVNNYSPEEIVAVFAHELGHYKKKDTLKLTAMSVIANGILIELALLVALSPAFSQAFGFAGAVPGFAFAAVMGVLFAPVAMLLRFPINLLSRRAEYQADAFAKQNGSGEALLSALRKISKDNFANVNPHPFIIATEYSHPTLSQRISAIKK